jgi:hypothetical protein
MSSAHTSSEPVNQSTREHESVVEGHGAPADATQMHINPGYGEVPLVNAASVAPNKLAAVISVQAVLNQFSVPKVRADFISGRFGCNINPNLLPRIDEFRWTLFPQWQTKGAIFTNATSEQASFHLDKLLVKSDELLLTSMDVMEDCLSYRDWMNALELIASSRYWERTPAESRCTHIICSDNELEPTAPITSSSSRAKSSSTTSKAITKKTNNSNDNSKELLKNKNTKKRITKTSPKVEEILISSSEASRGSTSTEDAPESCLSSADESDSSEQRESVVCRRKHRRQTVANDLREVVVPPVFTMDGRISLKDYLVTFEQFFDRKFKGNTYDKCQKLSTFLQGDLLNVYEIRGGRKLGYEEMKRYLLQYYKKQRIGGQRYWKKQFKECLPEPSESYDIYGMRLISLAEVAYPSSKKECARQLRQHFLASLPPVISSKIADAERTIKIASSGQPKHLAFEKLIQLATDLQREQPKPKSIMWSDQSSSRNATSGGPGATRYWSPRVKEYRPSEHASATAAKKTPSSGNPQVKANNPEPREREERPVSTSPRKNSPSCHYCHRPNHTQKECWRKMGACLICGKRHKMESCPRFDPKFKDRSGERNHRQLN